MRTPHGSPAVLLILALLVGLAAACTDPDTDASVSEGGTGSGSGSRPAASLAAPADCLTNPNCVPGLRHTYGVNATGAYRSTPIDKIADKVKNRQAMVGVIFSSNPENQRLREDGLVRLEDDQQMEGAENLVPVLSQKKAAALGPSFTDAVNKISAAVTIDDVAELRGDDGATPAEESAYDAWAEEHGPFGSGSGKVEIGAQSFPENRTIANMYAAGLRQAGFDASVTDVRGFRAYLWDAVVYGDVDLGVDYASAAVAELSGYQNVAAQDTARTMTLLRELAGRRDVTVLDPSPAESRNEFVMRADVAKDLKISTLSDLATQFPQVPKGKDVEQPELRLGVAPDDPTVGDTGERIVALEERLQELGYRPGPANGEFGAEDAKAVAKFQACQGLPLDGAVGAATRKALRNPAPCVEGATVTSNHVTTPKSPGPGKVVYLSFDDGPHPVYTPQVLALLKKYDARATFFLIGEQVAPNAKLVRAELAAGNHVGNHTWTHADLSRATRATYESEVQPTTKAIEKAGGQTVKCLRPPYGARNDSVDQWTKEASLIEELWTVDPQDWSRPGTDAIVSTVLGNVRNGSVTLMHDGGGDRSESVAALKQILPALKKQGYSFGLLPC